MASFDAFIDLDPAMLDEPFEILDTDHDFYLSELENCVYLADEPVVGAVLLPPCYSAQPPPPLVLAGAPPFPAKRSTLAADARPYRAPLLLPERGFMEEFNLWQKTLRQPWQAAARVTYVADYPRKFKKVRLPKFKKPNLVYRKKEESAASAVVDVREEEDNLFQAMGARYTIDTEPDDGDGDDVHTPEQHAAANVIKRRVRAFVDRRAYANCREKLQSLRRENPARLLKHLRWDDAAACDVRMGYQILFRLAGPQFPPHIIYKVCSSIPSADLNQGAATYTCGWEDYSWCLSAAYRKSRRNTAYPGHSSTGKRKQSILAWIPEHYKF